jgi:hypothetical protein
VRGFDSSCRAVATSWNDVHQAGTSGDGRGIPACLFQLFDSDVAKGHRAVFIFEADTAGAGRADPLRETELDRLAKISPSVQIGDPTIAPEGHRVRHGS